MPDLLPDPLLLFERGGQSRVAILELATFAVTIGADSIDLVNEGVAAPAALSNIGSAPTSVLAPVDSLPGLRS